MAKQTPRIKDLEDIRRVFEKYNVPFFVTYGAVLGFHRDGDFLPGDDDIDLAVVEPIDLETRKAIGWDLYHLGFQPQQIAFSVFGRMEPSGVGYNGDAETGIIVCERNFKFTIFFFKPEECEQHGLEYVCVPKLGAMKLISSPTKFYKDAETGDEVSPGNMETGEWSTHELSLRDKKYDTITINKKKYNVPTPVEDYLSFTYFDNWKDKTDRRHGHTYGEMHAGASITKDEVNSVQINE